MDRLSLVSRKPIYGTRETSPRRKKKTSVRTDGRNFQKSTERKKRRGREKKGQISRWISNRKEEKSRKTEKKQRRLFFFLSAFCVDFLCTLACKPNALLLSSRTGGRQTRGRQRNVIVFVFSGDTREEPERSPDLSVESRSERKNEADRKPWRRREGDSNNMQMKQKERGGGGAGLRHERDKKKKKKCLGARSCFGVHVLQ